MWFNKLYKVTGRQQRPTACKAAQYEKHWKTNVGLVQPRFPTSTHLHMRSGGKCRYGGVAGWPKQTMLRTVRRSLTQCRALSMWYPKLASPSQGKWNWLTSRRPRVSPMRYIILAGPGLNYPHQVTGRAPLLYRVLPKRGNWSNILSFIYFH